MSNEQQPQDEQVVNESPVEEVETEASEVEGELISPEQARIEELEAQLAEAKATLAEQTDSVLRAKADLENARRRAEGEVDKARKFALERFASELLNVVDNLERALLVADKENEALKPMLEGVEITLKSFVDALEKSNIKVLDPQGEAFNPELHQAMSMQPNAEVAPNTVLAVMQKGYELNGRLLRPAMVMVSSAPDTGVDVKA